MIPTWAKGNRAEIGWDRRHMPAILERLPGWQREVPLASR